MADGSHRADLLTQSKNIVGDTPLHVAAELHPVDAWRFWTITHPRIYTEESEEFEESLRIFERNAGLVREHNTKPGRPPWEYAELRNLADSIPADEQWSGTMPRRLTRQLCGPYAHAGDPGKDDNGFFV